MWWKLWYECCTWCKALQKISLGSADTVQTASVPEELSSRVAEQSCTVAQQSVQNLIRSLLIQHNITPERITVSVHVDDSGTIGISRAVVLLNSADYAREQEIRSWISAELGVTAECQCAGA